MSLPFASRPKGDVLCLFDVDGTLSLARQVSYAFRSNTNKLNNNKLVSQQKQQLY